MYEAVQSFRSPVCSVKHRGPKVPYLRAFSEEPCMVSCGPVSPANQAYNFVVVRGPAASSPACCHLRRSRSVTHGHQDSEDIVDSCFTAPSSVVSCDTSVNFSISDQNIDDTDKGDDDDRKQHYQNSSDVDKLGVENISKEHCGTLAVISQSRESWDTPLSADHSSMSDCAIASSQPVKCVSAEDKMSKVVRVPGETVVELIKYWGMRDDNLLPAFVSVDANGRKRELNRKEVLDFARRFAHQLKDLGIKNGDIVCNALPNSLERVVCEFGIQFSGATSMNGQIFRSDGEDFMEALRVSRCCAVICDPSVPNGARHVLLREVPLGCENAVQSASLPHLQRLIICARNENCVEKDFITSLKDALLPQYTAKVSSSDLSTVMTTSGSTGYSKLVKLTHSNICHFGRQVKAIEEFSSGERFINCAPLGWAGGYPQWFLSCGVTRYFLDLHDGPIPDLPAVIWRTIVQEKIVYGFLSPMYVNSILTHSSWQNASWKPRVLCLAGQLIKKGVLDIIGKLCDAVDVNYGITENNLVSTHRITDPTSYVEGCAGYPGYEVMVKVVDRNRCEVPKGTKGEILIWSPALCEGYLNNETANESAFTRDGWFCTDDAGYVGDDGKLYVEGRQSDSILRGAYILYPGWLETKMREFPGVKDIAVVAVPDKVLYHEICACVVVNGIKGVVPGVSVDSLSNHLDQMTSSSSCDTGDEVDNTAFIRNNIERNNILLSSEMQDEVSAYSGSKFPHHFNHTEHIVDPKLDGSPGSLDKIRTEGGNKSLSVSYNETKVRTENIPVVNETQTGKTGTTHREINVDGEVSPDLIRFEKELREFTNNLELLHEKDAMRMVPKHYIFTDAFPLTSTGKISRKEIRRIAASALGLDE